MLESKKRKLDIIEKNLLFFIQALSVFAVLYLFVYAYDINNGNKFLSVSLLSLSANIWWYKVDTITNDFDVRHHKNVLAMFLSSINLIFSLQWFVLETKGIYLTKNQALVYGLSWVFLHIAIAFLFFDYVDSKSEKTLRLPQQETENIEDVLLEIREELRQTKKPIKKKKSLIRITK